MKVLLTYCLFGICSTAMSTASAVRDGYTDVRSAFPGDSVDIYLNAADYIENFSLRWFTLGGKEVARFPVTVFPQQISTSRPYEDGFGYRRTARVAVPNVPSGVYLIGGRIPFIVKTRQAKVVVVYPSNTVNAYCAAGGKSLYPFNSSFGQAATAVSFHRPLTVPPHAIAFFRWMEKQPFLQVGYVVDEDLDEYDHLRNAALVIIPGHSEYWTEKARRHFDRFVREGRNAAILSGNTMWWHVRYNQQRDQLICYRDEKADPVKGARNKTILWNDPLLRYPLLGSIGVDFSNAGYGLKSDAGWDGYKIVSRSPLLANTGLKTGEILPLPSDELDGAPVYRTQAGVPVLNKQLLGFYRVELIGYDLVWRKGIEGVATWIVFQPTKTSGIVVNTASTNWCAENGIGAIGAIQEITYNIISKLLKGDSVFSPDNTNDGIASPRLLP